MENTITTSGGYLEYIRMFSTLEGYHGSCGGGGGGVKAFLCLKLNRPRLTLCIMCVEYIGEGYHHYIGRIS